MPLINSHTNWGRLEEVFLGDCYPARFYDHLPSAVRDCFYQITENTQHDLAIIQAKLEEFGVIVRRPHYERIDDFILPHNGQLEKPSITPRDYMLVAGNTLYIDHQSQPWDHAVADYRQDPGSIIASRPELKNIYLSGANTVRCGRDIYLDTGYTVTSADQVDLVKQEFDTQVAPMFEHYRKHLLFNGGHMDGCFAVIKPGLLLASHYFDDYERTFPDWVKINLRKPEFRDHTQPRRTTPGYNGKWYVPDMKSNAAFNDHVIKYAQTWVGDYTETFFEVNCLVIDEHNVLMLGENEPVFRELERHGVTAHSLPFRTRTFWDGGLHCLTVDIRRQDHAVDVFPERGEQDLFIYDKR
jgi:hypothetical protein